MLKIEKLNQYYGESHTLWDLDLDVTKGQCTCLMGRNGVGKTTLLQCIMGLLPIASGDINFSGESISKLIPERRAPLGIGYVPQGRQIFPMLTVEENLRIGLPVRKTERNKIPDFIFELFPVLKEMLDRKGGDLSGGQQQQLAIGRALVIDPQLLILDEPTEGIQPNIVQEIGDIIIKLNQEIGLTVLLVEQKLPFARKVADRFCILDRGRHVAAGEMGQLNDDLIRQYLTV
ncbi:MAG: urea ABC transporter ATP-binding subunit UrtE [gamma proteobacterium symbiont of Stewartia floridana]|uniref:Urea ABC transporter ATP-binding subunit UrtE n=1 Tax=Candidatus Thiodiazotropha taylori TaxID=2792791 RepID=A0A9E4P100_9GAMM|nr:urea ABC transporter ATP-binding subunit UrtE [Candidatus Thiodiazotropha taylori]MCG7963330.1 urea ABC transporter ATP-binding subunit UrtE [Candidatus Thiodiazotropha endolucinida]RLW56378.1 MAG: urea ABC transporter ATP-binding subunit UrtE [gamma proteobacterium symbiont of Stewartia floridana]MCG7896278.1 urea ABC transporter ATP-binding subunit UrtE [Candidatus Thiodiazotropha taylori]MCG7907712.1 urea ABC transporter ATP-binding subunit UrtE [Candidatus Thiodiazotropha taylori]